METVVFKQKRRKLTLFLTLLGFATAAVIWGYAELTAYSPPHTNIVLLCIFALLCPVSLLSAALIDIDPGTIDFRITWLVIGILNSLLYGVVAYVVGWFLWKPERNQ
jgi:hypothetical protein